jgi:outer membrane lipase/esterase
MLRTLVRFCTVLVFAALPMQGHALSFSDIYVLGDSLSDQGNLFAATAAIVGVANAVPAADHYFGGRFADGPNHADILAERLALPLVPSIAGGNNFAYGGARTDYNVAEITAGGPFPPGLFPWSLNRQIDAFSARGVHDPDALYVVFSGSNDIGDIITRGFDPGVVIPDVAGAIMRALEAFQTAGAQTIVVPNVPDLGLTPAFNTDPVVSAIATTLSAQYNALLQQELSAVTGARIVEFDTFGFLRNLVADPDRFGFADVSTPCFSGFVLPDPDATVCADPEAFVFHDLVHPTHKVHRLLADALMPMLSPATVEEPPTALLVLFGALVLLVRRRCRLR